MLNIMKLWQANEIIIMNTFIFFTFFFYVFLLINYLLTNDCMGSEDQSSFFIETDEDKAISPMDLSGDQGAERSVLVSDAASKKANFLLTVTTIMKSVMGTGIVSLPFTVSRIGYVLAPILYLIMLCVAQFTATMLLKAKNLSRHSNYASIMYHIFRRHSLEVLCASAILLGNTGICIAELTLFKAALKQIIDSYVAEDIQLAFYTQKYFIVIVIALLEVPLTLVKKIQRLKFFAFFGVGGIFLFLVAMFINFFVEMGKTNWQCSPTTNAFPISILQVGAVIPNVMLSLCFHQNFFPIFKALKNSTDSKMKEASLTALSACALCYILTGLMGSCIYGRKTNGNFLLNFQRTDIPEFLYILLNGGFLVSVFFSFPVMFFGARNNFIAIMKLIVLKIKKAQVNIGDGSENRLQDQIPQNNSASHKHTDNPILEISSYVDAPQSMSPSSRKFRAKLHFYLYTSFLFLVMIGTAILVDSVQDVFSIVGAIASNSKAILFPCLFYFAQIIKKDKDRKIKFYFSVSIFVVFACLGINGIVSNFIVGGGSH